MGRLVGVHGIGKQQLGRHQLLASWAPALADGVERAVRLRGHPSAVVAGDPPVLVIGSACLAVAEIGNSRDGILGGTMWQV
jgi:hypothetical protein